MSALPFQPDAKPVILRPYQEQMTQAIHAAWDRGIQRALVVSATGTGKTTVMWEILSQACRNDLAYTALCIAHRRELLHQIKGRGREQAPWISSGIESGEESCPKGARVAVASVQSIGRPGSSRLDWLGPRLVIADEAHHAAASTWQNVFRRFGCYEEQGTLLLGVTATPHRLDNKALHSAKGAIFEELVFDYNIIRAIKDGFLVDLRGYRACADLDLSKVKKKDGDYVASSLEKVVNVEPVTELAFKSWSEVASNRQTIIFCAGVDHAKDVAEIFCRHGVKAEAVWGDMSPQARAEAIRKFHSGEIQVLTNMEILTEGFDAVACACIILLRPTQSWSLFTQMVGRGLRVLPGIIEGIGEPAFRRVAIADSQKPDCIVIDIVSNTSAHSVGVQAKSEDIPSLQALVGLPSALDMEGATLAEAVEQFDNLPAVLKAAAFRRQTSFSGLTAQLTQIEMLAELDLPEECKAAGTSLFWLKTGELSYLLDIGNSVGGTVQRKALLQGDFIGNWVLHLQSFDSGRTLRDEQIPIKESIDLADVFRMAEHIIGQRYPGVGRMAATNAKWREGAPTDDQKAALRAAGVSEDLIQDLDKGTASQMLTFLEELKRKGEQ